MDVLALLLYGVMLFPNVQNFIDNASINAFVGYKDRSKNPVTVVLAEVYGTLNHCYEKKGGQMLCCLPVLYVWFVSRVIENALNATCPVDELLQCKPNMKGTNEWAQLCANLNVEQIKWNVLWMQRSQIIYYCGRYPNVPLMGIQCCINYNLVLAQRQFGMLGGNVVRAERDPRPWAVDERIPYNHWIAERVKTVRLPFELISLNLDCEEQHQKAEDEEVQLLKAELERMKLENIKLTVEISERVMKQMCDEFKKDKEKALEDLHKIHIRVDDAEQQAKAAVTKLKKERWHRAEAE
ncbi:uncharacterized protein LOC106770498 [Vigna radiata var. radiata]|uniref:Uncharacterized protein LOC106770498 n=1 Tax=Vigna radiata var. radiata TaxID=3916 RepID=A0A1S3V0D1_VIGRR|nr:uncharacterized protein LOC106770498 [Vigna radiata var. radiata]